MESQVEFLPIQSHAPVIVEKCFQVMLFWRMDNTHLRIHYYCSLEYYGVIEELHGTLYP